MKKVLLLITYFAAFSSAYAEIEMIPPKSLASAEKISLLLVDSEEKKEPLTIKLGESWTNEDYFKNPSKIRAVIFEFKDKSLPHLINVEDGNALLIFERIKLKYSFQMPFKQFMATIFPEKMAFSVKEGSSPK